MCTVIARRPDVSRDDEVNRIKYFPSELICTVIARRPDVSRDDEATCLTIIESLLITLRLFQRQIKMTAPVLHRTIIDNRLITCNRCRNIIDTG